jgi:hypothetical protein
MDGSSEKCGLYPYNEGAKSNIPLRARSIYGGGGTRPAAAVRGEEEL